MVAEAARATYEDGILRVELPLRGRREEPHACRSSRGTPMAEGSRSSRRRDLEARRFATRERQPLPGALPVLPLRDMVTYPETLTPLAVGQERSMRLVNDVLSGDRMLVMVASRDPELDEPGPDDLYAVGVAGVVARMLKVPDGTIRILVQGTERVRITDFVTEEPYLVARIEPMPDVSAERPSCRR